jgi:hypothetical protein
MQSFDLLLKELDAPFEMREWAKKNRTLGILNKSTTQLINECPYGDWLLWLAEGLNINIQTLFLANGNCALKGISYAKDKHIQHYRSSYDAIMATIAFGKGEITTMEAWYEIAIKSKDAFTRANNAHTMANSEFSEAIENLAKSFNDPNAIEDIFTKFVLKIDSFVSLSITLTVFALLSDAENVAKNSVNTIASSVACSSIFDNDVKNTISHIIDESKQARTNKDPLLASISNYKAMSFAVQLTKDFDEMCQDFSKKASEEVALICRQSISKELIITLNQRLSK